jgi:hypothetical protein
MIFGVTDQGFNRKLESDISGEIAAEVAPLFGVDPATVDWPPVESPTSQFIKPFARQLGILWEQMEAVFQGMDPAQAFGTMMDALLALNNIARLESTPTLVLAAISGTQGTVVPAGTRVSVLSTAALFEALANATITNANLIRFNVQIASASDIGTPFSMTLNGNAISSGALGGSPTRDTIALKMLAAINAASSVNAVMEAVFYGTAVIQIATLASLTAYTATINGEAMTYTSDASAAHQEVIDGLVAAINAGQSSVVAAGIDSTSFSLTHRVPSADWALILTSNLSVASLTPIGAFAVKSANLSTPFSGSVDSRMAIDRLYSPQAYASVAGGPIEAPSGTLTAIETQVSGFAAVTNFLDGALGRDVESDDEARVRREETLSTGSAHTRAVLSAINRLPGVTLSRAYENIMDTVDADGRPGHSVEFLVQGGDDLAVAQVIWDGRAAGIVPFGNINADGSVDVDGSGSGITAEDSNGVDQVVHYSRPEPRYAFIIAVKTLYSEEEFPDEGDEAIRQALLTFGNAVGIGKDFLIQRFIGPAVSVPGVGSVALQIAISDDPDDGSPTYGTANIAISPRQVLVFDTSRIDVS